MRSGLRRTAGGTHCTTIHAFAQISFPFRMWFWFTALLLHFYCDTVDAASPDFGKRYLQVADAAQKIQAQLESNFERLAKDWNTPEEDAAWASL